MDTETNQLKQSLEILLEGVPVPVRRFILNDLGPRVNVLMSKYNLHIDQAGVLEQELLLMLLGQQTPTNFSERLHDQGIPTQTVQMIVSDVNESIFKKLQEEERTVSVSASVEPERVPPAPKVPLAQVPNPLGEMGARALNSTQQLDVSEGTAIPHPWQTSPARSFQTASVPYTSVPYTSESIESKSISQPYSPSPEITAPRPAQPAQGYIPPSPPPAPPPPTNPLGREYAIDPYREPIQ